MGLTRFAGNARISGSIMFDGKDLLTASDEDMRQLRGNDIAMIFQDPLSSLHPFYKVGEQIVEAVQAHRDVSKAQALDRAVEMLGLVGIPEPRRRVESYPHEFSGGMRQRVMIAMALANDPKLLIADEPTTALDVTVQAQILELIERLQRELDTAVVIITHDLGVVAEMADDIAVMYAGRIVEHADTDTIFAAPEHPYTLGAAQVDPAPGLAARRGARADPGRPPSLIIKLPGAAPSTRAAPTCAMRTSASTRSSRRPPTPATRRHQVACLLGAAAPGAVGARCAPAARRTRPARVGVPTRPSTATAVGEGLAPAAHRGAPGPRSRRARGHARRRSDAMSANGAAELDRGPRPRQALPAAPGHHLPEAGRRGAGRRRHLLRRLRGRDARAGRRVGLRQVDDRAAADAPARADRRLDRLQGQRDRARSRGAQLKPLRRDMQMIFQDPYSSLNPRKTVGSIIGEPFIIQGLETDDGKRKKLVQELMDLVGLNPEHYNRYPHEFSGGQRQRIGVARAIALKPKLDRRRRARLRPGRLDPGADPQPAAASSSASSG